MHKSHCISSFGSALLLMIVFGPPISRASTLYSDYFTYVWKGQEGTVDVFLNSTVGDYTDAYFEMTINHGMLPTPRITEVFGVPVNEGSAEGLRDSPWDTANQGQVESVWDIATWEVDTNRSHLTGWLSKYFPADNDSGLFLRFKVDTLSVSSAMLQYPVTFDYVELYNIHGAPIPVTVQPFAILVFTPEPSSVALAVFALVGLITLCRRKRG